MSNAITAGSEVDAWCTKCKLDLNHRIIAMTGPKIVRVECLTCRGHHAYRRPKSGAQATAAKRKRSPRAKAVVMPARKTLPPVISNLKQHWRKTVLGRTDGEFERYTISGMFTANQLVRHKKFGDGLVTEVTEDGKVIVLFEVGLKKLVHGHQQ